MAAQDPHRLLWKLILNHTIHGQICQNGFYFVNRGIVNDDEATLASHANALRASFETRMLTDFLIFWNNQVSVNSIHVSTIVPHLGPVHETIYETFTGFQTDEALPSYCSAVLSLRSGLGGKSRRGRLYIGGLSENDTNTGRLGPDSFAQLVVIGNKLIANYGATGSDTLFRFVIYSRLLGPSRVNGGPIVGVTPVTHCNARLILGTQRHRLIGVGT